MSGNNKILPLDGCANLISRLIDDFSHSVHSDGGMPKKNYL